MPGPPAAMAAAHTPQPSQHTHGAGKKPMFWQQATMSTKRRRVVRKHVRHPPAPEYEKAGAAGAEAGAVGASSSTTSPFTILTIASTALPVPPAIFIGWRCSPSPPSFMSGLSEEAPDEQRQVSA